MKASRPNFRMKPFAELSAMECIWALDRARRHPCLKSNLALRNLALRDLSLRNLSLRNLSLIDLASTQDQVAKLGVPSRTSL
jgi:hypothetical protein